MMRRQVGHEIGRNDFLPTSASILPTALESFNSIKIPSSPLELGLEPWRLLLRLKPRFFPFYGIFLFLLAMWNSVSDELLGTFVPILVYWAYSGFYSLLGSFDNYRLHSRKDEDVKNSVSKGSVVKGVLLQQMVQAVVAIVLFTVTSNSDETMKLQPSLIVLVRQFLVAMLVLDTWQYFMHRYMHHNKFLYKHIHSQHHRLLVPYAFGALYNHPLEGLLLDTIGGALSFLASGMSPRASIFFFSFATIKTVDDHCGLWFPGNPFHMLFRNNTAYHDIHHQLYGNKYNFSQPFFVTWDKMLGTYMPYSLEKRKGGGFEVRPAKD